MENTEQVRNRMAQSKQEILDLEDLRPSGKRVVFDLKDWLFQGLIVREKDFKAHLKEENWQDYEGMHVAVLCSADAIVPTWAFMSVVAALTPHARTVVMGDLNTLEQEIFRRELAQVDWEEYVGKKVVIKGCSKEKVPDFVYGEAVRMLSPLAKLIRFGEPCSSMPVYKRPRSQSNNL